MEASLTPEAISDEGVPAARILVVDDEEANRRLLRKLLEKLGYEVHDVAGGQEALALLGHRAIDLVLLDLMMPGMTGHEVLRELRRTWATDELPVIIATARTEADDLVEAMAAGANDYVTKPFDTRVLAARISARLKIDRRPRPREADPELLGGRYRLGARIGQGGDGVVHEATHVELQKTVAIKLVRLPGADPGTLDRLRREGVAACRLDHPNAVKILDFGVTDERGEAWLVMERLVGHDLDEELRRRARLSLERAAEVLRPVCAVLSEAHSNGLLHRDVKPANVFLHHGGRGEVVKLLDFGVARLLDRHARSSSRHPIGTLSYMAPERLQMMPHDGKADVYSLGVVLFELLTGAPPFDTRVHSEDDVAAMQVHQRAPRLDSVLPGMNVAVANLVAAALDKDPSRRPTAGGFGLELGMAVSGL